MIIIFIVIIIIIYIYVCVCVISYMGYLLMVNVICYMVLHGCYYPTHFRFNIHMNDFGYFKTVRYSWRT